MYESGNGVTEPREAVRWYRLAANQGNESAIDRLKELDVVGLQEDEESPKQPINQLKPTNSKN